MANNKAVRILRGTNNKIYSHRTEILEPGQLLYNMDKKYLTIGKSSTTRINALPIVVREISGLFADTNEITNATTGDNYYINDNSGNGLKIYSSKGIDITGAGTVSITGGTITCNKAPIVSEVVPANDSSTKTATTNWVKTATGNTSLNAASANKLNTDAGSNTKFVYFNNGVPVVTTNTTGANTKPVYFNNGTVTASTATVGSSTKPVYFNNGTVTQTGDSLAVSITGNANTASNANNISINGTYRTVSFSGGILSFS